MANTTGKKFGGRKMGTPNKSTSEIRALAQEYGPEAIRRLVSLMRQRDDHKVQLAAAKELLDRGYGRPMEVVESGNDYIVKSNDNHTVKSDSDIQRLQELVARVRARIAASEGVEVTTHVIGSTATCR